MDKTVPLGRVKGTLTPPCSKSYAQRALAASLLCGETSVLRNLEFCDDTRSALRCIETLGARVKHVDASTLSIEGGLHPRGKVLHVGESGLATRLFTPIASLCGMPVTIEGQGTLLRRPMHMMIDPLRRLGVRVRDNDGYLPFEVRGPIRGGEIDVDGSVSSQFITGLLLALPLSQHDTTLHVRSAVSTPYLDMTVDTAARFGVEICHNDYKEFYIEGGQRYRPAFFSIEGDWSAAAMLLVAGAVAGEVTVKNVSMLSKQADTAICTALVRAGAAVINDEDSVTASHRPLRAFEFDATHCPDLFPALAALAAAAQGESVIRGTSRLEHKECNRADAIREEYAKAGIEVDTSQEDVMRIRGGRIRQAEGGIFTRGGYVVPDGAWQPSQNPEPRAAPEPPAGIFRLKLRLGEEQAKLTLPAGRELVEVRERMESIGLSACAVASFHSRVPQIPAEWVTPERLEALNCLAQRLAALAEQESLALTKYKAVLEASPISSLEEAIALTERLDAYNLDRKPATPEDVAREELSCVMMEEDVTLIERYLNIYGYGEALIQQYEGELTNYGPLTRADGRPVQEPLPSHPGLNSIGMRCP